MPLLRPTLGASRSRGGLVVPGGPAALAAELAGAGMLAADLTAPGGGGSINWDLGSNRPGSGWTLARDNQWTSQWGTGWDIATNRAPNPAPQIVTDPTGSQPTTVVEGVSKSSSSLLQVNYAGTPDGEEPQYPFTSWTATQELFFSQALYFPASWSQPDPSPTGVKWLLVEGSVGAGLVGWFGLGPAGAQSTTDGPGEFTRRDGLPGTLTTDEIYMDWVFDASANSPYNGIIYYPSVRNEPLSKGTWCKLDCYLLSGATDRVMMWVNDQLVTDSSLSGGGFAFTNSGQNFVGIQYGATWGGGIGFPAPAGNHYYVARTAIWRK